MWTLESNPCTHAAILCYTNRQSSSYAPTTVGVLCKKKNPQGSGLGLAIPTWSRM